MVPLNLKVLAKFSLCSNCSQKLDECSLAHAYKIFSTARMLRISFKFSAVWHIRIICTSETKTDAGKSVSHRAKLGNIGETWMHMP